MEMSQSESDCKVNGQNNEDYAEYSLAEEQEAPKGQHSKADVQPSANNVNKNSNVYSDDEDEEQLQLINSFFSQQIFDRGQAYNSQQPYGGETSCQLREEVPQLIQLLHNERMAADLLPYQTKLVQQILMLIASQERTIQTKTDQIQNNLNNRQHNGNNHDFQEAAPDTDDHFTSILLKMELERVKFMLKSYLRARISKIERHLLFVIEKDQSQLLSDSEMQFAFDLFQARKNLLKDTIFNQLPQKLNFMDKDTIDDQYISQPNLEYMVFVRILAQIDEHYAVKEHIQVELRQFQVYFLPYSGIKKLLEEGKAELL